jgi:hypothetical protein
MFRLNKDADGGTFVFLQVTNDHVWQNQRRGY